MVNIKHGQVNIAGKQLYERIATFLKYILVGAVNPNSEFVIVLNTLFQLLETREGRNLVKLALLKLVLPENISPIPYGAEVDDVRVVSSQNATYSDSLPQSNNAVVEIKYKYDKKQYRVCIYFSGTLENLSVYFGECSANVQVPRAEVEAGISKENEEEEEEEEASEDDWNI